MGTADGNQNDNRLKFEEDLNKLLLNLSDIDLSGDIFDETASLDATGGYCDIFVAKSRRHSNVAVAVKRLRVHILRNENAAKVILRELRIWSSLNHPNILPLLGYCMHGAYPAFVSQWMFNGSVLNYMAKAPDVSIMRMSEGIAAGLLYLHDREIVHSDLKSDNILISDSGEPLLADFGISRIMSTSTLFNSTSIKGSSRWMAIELWMSSLNEGDETGGHTKETDIWAFGMVIYELLTGRVPFYQLKNDLQVSFAVAKGQIPTRPTALDDTYGHRRFLWGICLHCWRTSIPDRPGIISINDQFASRSLSLLAKTKELQNSKRLDSDLSYTNSRNTATNTRNSGTQLFSRSTSAPTIPEDRYADWISEILTPLGDFIDHSTDPRELYADLMEIAEGVSGLVYSARVVRSLQRASRKTSHSIGCYVAIKRIPLLPGGSPTLIDLHNELTILSKIQGHENILSMDALHMEVAENCLWIEMDLMERSLADMLQLSEEGFALEESVIAQFTKEILTALSFLESLGIAHRDVRSDNILIQSNGNLKLTDFARAVQLSSKSAMRSDIVGVYYWRAPEVHRGPYDARKVDVWSLGATVWEMAEAKPPFEDVDDPRKMPDTLPPLRHPEDQSGAFHEFLRLCSSPPSTRPSATQLLTVTLI